MGEAVQTAGASSSAAAGQPALKRLLVANRGEIAIRVLRAAADLGMETVALYAEDDARSLHVVKADDAQALTGRGAAAYLNAARIVEIARETGCDALHPGYGFLAENAAFARACETAGVTFVGPRPETLELFGDKAQARALAARCGVPLFEGTSGATSLDEGRTFFDSLGPDAAVMVKALAGGGGRGMREVHSADALEPAWERCRSEAKAAFGDEAVYLERLIPHARHIEVQVVGDGDGAVTHLYERECTLQRQHQKLVEVAPAPDIPATLRERLTSAALEMAAHTDYRSLGTFEFLVDADDADPAAPPRFAFMEANPRLQVEHTVTEEVLGLDLVRTQLELAAGSRLADLGLAAGEQPAPRGHAIQLRLNMETMRPDATALPGGGTLDIFELPSGPGVRVDTYGYAGYTTSPAFDSLLAKLIVHTPSGAYGDAVRRAYRALCETRIGGVPTNLDFLKSLLVHPDVAANRVYTRFIEAHIGSLVGDAAPAHRKLHFSDGETEARVAGAGARVDANDPLAVLAYGRDDASSLPTGEGTATSDAVAPAVDGPTDTVAVRAPMQGTIVSVDVAEGASVRRGQQLLVMDAMKMEHVIEAEVTGLVRRIAVAPGEAVFIEHPLVFIEAGAGTEDEQAVVEDIDVERMRPDLEEVLERHAFGFDANREEAVAKRHGRGHRTARENLADLVDDDTFIEYGPVTVAAQRRRREMDDLIRRTPADGMIAGIGSVNGAQFDETRSQTAIMSYDYMVLAGTQGTMNHRKKDRMIEVAERSRLPSVFFTEGGGGRPGDTDGIGVAGLDCLAFWYWGRLSGQVPMIGISNGRCFAGNAALLGCCDVVIATKDSNIGMGGPAMVEGGGLGVFRPEEIGPADVQRANGVVDVAVADEAEAVAVARQYLAYFQGSLPQWSCDDQRRLRHLIPENRLRVYDIRGVIHALADTDSVLELRRGWGHGMITTLARVEGRPVGIIANNPAHLSGAIDSPAADKAARFMQLCDAFNLPILSLCDTPGIMVGPEVEKTALVRHAARMFVTAGSITVPLFTVVLRKGYGLGAQAMAGGSFKAPMFTLGWPTSEFGGMGLEGAVKLGYRNELAAIDDPEARKAKFEEMVDRMYERGKGVNTASHFEIDDVIDPGDTRKWLVSGMKSTPLPYWRDVPPKRPCIDSW